MVKKTRKFLTLLFLYSLPLYLNAQTLEENLKNKNYSKALEEILEKIRQDEEIIEKYPSILPYFSKKSNPESYSFFLEQTHILLEKKFYKESLRMYKILSYFEKDDPLLFENYKKAYVFYTNSILRIKKAFSYYNTGEISLTKKMLKDLENEIPKESHLYEMVVLGNKEVQKKIHQDYVIPGLARIEEKLTQFLFTEAKGDLAILKNQMTEDSIIKTQEKIKKSEKSYYYQKSEEKFKNQEYEEALSLLRLLLEQYPDDNEIEKKLATYREAKLKAEMQAEAFNHLKQGDFYLAKKDHERAVFYYKNYLDLVKDDPEMEKKIQSLEQIIKEEQERKYFYEQYNKALNLIKTSQYEQALTTLLSIQDAPYEKEKLPQLIDAVKKELELIRKEKENESQAINYREQGNYQFSAKNYKDALDNYVLALSLLEEIRGREGLKKEIRELISKTQAIIKEVERKKAEERLRKIEQGINRGRQEYILGNYEKSLIYFQDVLEIDSDNLIVKDYIYLATEALKTSALGVISSRDPFYTLFLSLREEGLKLQKEGIQALKKGQQEKGIHLLNDAVNKWQTIKRAYPYHEESRKNLRDIFKHLDPEGFKRTIQEDLDKALELAGRDNKPAAYKIVKEIQEEVPNFPRINYYLEQTKPKEQRKILTLEERKAIQKEYNTVLGMFGRREYQDALKLSEKIINTNKNAIDPIMDDVKSLYLRIKRNIDAASIKSLDLTMPQIIERTKHYREAMDFYQKQDYKKTIEAAQKALKIDPSYTSAQSLLEAARKRLNL